MRGDKMTEVKYSVSMIGTYFDKTTVFDDEDRAITEYNARVSNNPHMSVTLLKRTTIVEQLR